MATFGRVLPLLVMFGRVWPISAAFGRAIGWVWPAFVAFGRLWPTLVAFGCAFGRVWLCMDGLAAFGRVIGQGRRISIENYLFKFNKNCLVMRLS